MKLSSKRAKVLNSSSYFLNDFHILFALLQSKQLLWQLYLPAVHSFCDHSYPHRRHLGLQSLLDESRASVFTIEIKYFSFLQSSQGLGLSAGRKGGYHIGPLMQLSGHLFTVHKKVRGGSASCSMLQKTHTHRFMAPSVVQMNPIIRKCFLRFVFLLKRNAQVSLKIVIKLPIM